MDLKIAEELGGVKAYLAKIDENLTRHCLSDDTAKQALWSRIDEHAATLATQNGMIRWIIGIGIGIQAAWLGVLSWLKT